MVKNKKIIIPDMYNADLEVRDSLNMEKEGIVIQSLQTQEAIVLGKEGAIELRNILDQFIEYGTTAFVLNK